MADSDIELKITVNDSALEKGERGFEALAKEATKASQQIEKIDDEDLSKIRQSIERTEQRLKSMVSVAKGVGAALAVGRVAEVGKEFLQLGAKVAASEDALRSMLGAKGLDSGEFLERMRGATKGLATDLDLMQQSVRAVSFGIPIDQLAKLTEETVHYARVTGLDVPAAIERMVQGIGKQEAEWLDELGLKIKLTEAKEKYVEGTDRSIKSLSAEETQIAFVNEALRQFAENNEKIGSVQDRTIDSVNRLIVAFENQRNELVQSIVEAEGFEQGMISLTKVIISGAKSILYVAEALDRFGNFLARNINGMEVASFQIDKVFNKIEGGSEVMGQFYQREIQKQRELRKEWEKTNKASRFIPGAGPQEDPKEAYNRAISAAQTAIDKLEKMGAKDPSKALVALAKKGIQDFGAVTREQLEEVEKAAEKIAAPKALNKMADSLSLASNEAQKYEEKIFKLTASARGLTQEAARLEELRKNGGAAEEIEYLEKIVKIQDELRAQKEKEKKDRKDAIAARKQKAKDDREDEKQKRKLEKQQERIADWHRQIAEDFKQTEKYKDIWEDYSKGLISYDDALQDVRDSMVGYQAIASESAQATAELEKAAEGFAKGKGSFEDLAQGMLKAEKAGAQLQKFGEKAKDDGFFGGLASGLGIDLDLFNNLFDENAPEATAAEKGEATARLGAQAFNQAFEEGISRENIGEVGGSAIGAAVASQFGPAAGEAARMGSTILIDAFSGWGKDSKGTELRKEIDKFFAEAFEANRIALVIDGELTQLDDLAIKPFLEGSQIWDSAMIHGLAEPLKRGFSVVGNAVGTLFGDFGELKEQGIDLGAVLADNLGGDLNNLQQMMIGMGITAEQLEQNMINTFLAGEISAVEASASFAEIQGLFEAGIPGAIGATVTAYDNLYASEGRGMGAVDALRDLGAEALETGSKIKDLAGLQINLIEGGRSASEVEALFRNIQANGISTLEELRDASDRTAISILGNLQTENFMGFGDVSHELRTLSEYADDLERERYLRIRVEASASKEDRQLIEKAAGGRIPNLQSGGAFA